jgi:hypothetical protein
MIALIFLGGIWAANAEPALAATRTVVTLTPNTGPIGTVVNYHGHMSHADLQQLVRGEPLHGLEGGPGRCELDMKLPEDVIHLNRKTGDFSGTFQVGSTGVCKHLGPSFAPVRPGTYFFYLGCEACELAPFTVSADHPSSLPFTGGSELIEALTALLLVTAGATLVVCSRPRRLPRF